MEKEDNLILILFLLGLLVLALEVYFLFQLFPLRQEEITNIKTEPQYLEPISMPSNKEVLR